jgi:dihydroorotate dehydrogenase
MLDIESDPYSMFIFAMNAPQTREKYVTRLKRFGQIENCVENNIESPHGTGISNYPHCTASLR